ncbi:MAG: RadC family protein [Clostridia bacterium]|nr:RadC family protein [Clostridia bacterium]
MAVKKNIHSGHRQRLKERFLREGLDGFEKHNILELLLFYTIPQRDTNPIAHALLNRFGSLKGVFAASLEELCTVNGVSEHTATLIKMIPEVWRNVASEVLPDVRYDSVDKLGRLMIDRYAGMTVEAIFLVLMDNSWHILEIVKLGEGSVNQVRMDTRKLIEHAIRTNAAMAVLTHNHPNGTLVPSPEDMVTTTEVAHAFRTIRVEFLEHLLIAGNKYEPLLSKAEGIFWQKSKTDAFYNKD